MIWSPFFSLALLCFGTVARAAVITVNWNVTWVWASPDGFGRPVIGIDNQWPCPKLEATVGDTLIVNLHNGLGNQTTGLHWHGINQLQTPEMDGPSGVVQCPTPPGSTVQYKFLVRHMSLLDSGSNRGLHDSSSMSPAPSGITPTKRDNTRMACAAPLLSKIPMTPTRASTTRRLS